MRTRILRFLELIRWGLIPCGCLIIIVCIGPLLIVSVIAIGFPHYSQPADPARHNHRFTTMAPSITADGDQLVFASQVSGNGDIYLFRPNERHLVSVVDTPAVEVSPVITGNGAAVAFSRGDERGADLWLVRTRSHHEIQLTHHGSSNYPIEFSADGRFLLYSRVTYPSIGLGSTVTQHVIDVESPEYGSLDVGHVAVFSADGKSIYFSDQSGLWSLEFDDWKDRRRLPIDPGWPSGVSPDGRFLLISRSTSQSEGIDREIWLQDLQAETGRTIALGHSPIIWGVRRQRVMFFTGYKGDAYVVDIDGDQRSRLSLPAGSTKCFRRSPDGRTLLGASYSGRHVRTSGMITIDAETLQISTRRIPWERKGEPR